MKFIDLFAGIGGFRLGMEMAGHKAVGWCEIDKFAQKSYKAMYDTKGEWFADDIRTIEPRDMPDFDYLTGGFPCQSFSVAGKRGGFEDTRGTLFFEIARIIQERQPKLVFLENVKGLLNHDGGRTFGTILNTFWELGYDVEWQLLNSKDFGVPQNRERVFIVGYPRGTRTGRIFPIAKNNPNIAKGFQGDVSGKGYASQQDRVYEIDGLMNCLPASQTKNKTKILVRAVITPNRVNKRQNGRRFKEEGEPMFTLTSQDKHGVLIKEATKKGFVKAEIGDSINVAFPSSKTRRGRVEKGIAQTLDTQCMQGTLTEDLRIRQLTPKECWRLQGFPDEYFDRAREVNSDSQLYKQAGNSVTVNVIYEIAKRI